MFCLFFLHMKMFVLIYKTFNGLPSLYPTSPALRGARALAREARRADSRRAQKTICVDQS